MIIVRLKLKKETEYYDRMENCGEEVWYTISRGGGRKNMLYYKVPRQCLLVLMRIERECRH
jgi:hypothetical protein